MIEEAHRAQNAYVRRNPVHRIAHNTALYALDESGLLGFHKFNDSAPLLAEEHSDMQIDDAFFAPTERGSWSGLKGLPGWSRTSKWYSPAADCVHDSTADLLVFKYLADFSKLEAVQLWLPLLSGTRTILQEKESGQWFLCVVTMGGLCGIGLPLKRHQVGVLLEFWTLDPPENEQDVRPLLITDPSKWSATTFVWASPLYQFHKDPSKALLAATGSRIVVMAEGPVDDLHLHAARAAFFSIGKAVLIKMATQLKVEVPTSSDLFAVCWTMISSLLKVDDEQVLKIMEQRAVKQHAQDPNDRALKHFDEMKDVMTKEEQKQHKDLKESLDLHDEAGSTVRKSMRKLWKEKHASIKKKKMEEPPKKRAKKKVAPGLAGAPKELEPIEHVRAAARRSLPDGTMEQADVKAMLPPDASIWNNWRGQAWHVHLKGHTRDHEGWLEHAGGRDEAALVLLARTWRTWLAENDGEEHDCPIEGLLAY